MEIRKKNNKNTKKNHKEIKGQLRKIEIENFKQFGTLKLDDFGKINIFFGNNNCGKSSLLEAIFTYSSGYNYLPPLNQFLGRRASNIKGFYDYGERILNVFGKNISYSYSFNLSGSFEGVEKEISLSYSFKPSDELSVLDPQNMGFSNGENEFEIENGHFSFLNRKQNIIYSNIENKYLGTLKISIQGKDKSFKLSFPPILTNPLEPPLKLATFHDILSHRNTENDTQIYSHLKRYNKLSEATEEMRKAFSEIEEIDFIPYPDGKGNVYIKTKNRNKIPLYLFGDGMRRWFYLLGNMMILRNSIHCIEEIDATLHYAIQKDFSRNLYKYSQNYNNQLFITSHNIEFVDNFLEALYNGKDGILKDAVSDPIRIFTFKVVSSKKVQELRIWKLTGKEAYERRKDLKVELR